MSRSAGPDDPRILSEGQCAALAKRILGAAKGGGETDIRIQSWASGDVHWSGNQVTAASDRRDVSITVTRTIDTDAAAVTVTNQIDDGSLVGAVQAAERALALKARLAHRQPNPPFTYRYPKTATWSEATRTSDAARRRDSCRSMIATAEQRKMLSSGYLEHRLGARANYDSWGRTAYAPYTTAQCSTTVRNAKGTGSGWAGLSSYDWQRIDPTALATRALEKCVASQDPVALEPGRYTVILEPQAVGDLLWQLVYAFNRARNEFPLFHPRSPFHLKEGQSKLGLRVIDSRITLRYDPADPELGAVPFGIDLSFEGPSDGVAGPRELDWEPPRPVTWIDNGVLTALAYSRDYALEQLRDNAPLPFPPAFRMSGGTTTIEQMIASTPRGVLVTRFSQVGVINEGSALMSGLTRDGLWLIEQGKITKPVKNLRFAESPVFMLNNVLQLGPPVPIFAPALLERLSPPASPLSPRLPWLVTRPQFADLSQLIVPAIKAKDFSFTSMADAI